MAKRKYATFSDPEITNPTYECTKRKCKWQGKDNEKIQIQHPEYRSSTTSACPKCGNNEFYRLLENNP
nr:hypothetical protein [uncultured Flavobacterium sp.]